MSHHSSRLITQNHLRSCPGKQFGKGRHFQNTAFNWMNLLSLIISTNETHKPYDRKGETSETLAGASVERQKCLFLQEESLVSFFALL